MDTEGGLTDAKSTLAVVDAVKQGSIVNPQDVEYGRKVNAFFITIFVIGSTGAPVVGSVNWYLAKAHSGQSQTADFPDPLSVGLSPVRNQIIHQEKGLVGSGDGTAMAFKGVIVVPRGMRRMREGDSWFISIKVNSATDPAQFCYRAIYKSFG